MKSEKLPSQHLVNSWSLCPIPSDASLLEIRKTRYDIIIRRTLSHTHTHAHSRTHTLQFYFYRKITRVHFTSVYGRQHNGTRRRENRYLENRSPPSTWSMTGAPDRCPTLTTFAQVYRTTVIYSHDKTAPNRCPTTITTTTRTPVNFPALLEWRFTRGVPQCCAKITDKLTRQENG